jgi:hypothetical protein
MMLFLFFGMGAGISRIDHEQPSYTQGYGEVRPAW